MRICEIEGCERKHYGKGYCEFHYRRCRTGFDMLKTHRKDISTIDRLMSKVIKNRGPNNSCWDVTGSLLNSGYGRIKKNGKSALAHRFSWEYHNKKKIPEGLCVLHSCDNRSCVNPEHLRLGTHQDNMDDMAKRNISIKGENHHRAKLTEDKVLKIYKDAHAGESLTKMAKNHGVSVQSISHIKLGRAWAHITKHEKRLISEVT